jgi:hypothetical protein
MHALTEMTTAHPIGSLWVALTIFVWIAIQVMTGGVMTSGVRRRRGARPSAGAGAKRPAPSVRARAF